MLIEELFGAIREKEELLQRVRAEVQRLEKDIETLRAAVRVLEREAATPTTQEPVAVTASRGAAPETIRKAFP